MPPSVPWPPAEYPSVVQATAISVIGRGALIIGPSGSGKSSLAFQLMALGADLIADDLTQLRIMRNRVWLFYPPQAPKDNQIEARGLGILPASRGESAPLELLIDMSEAETKRLPEPSFLEFAGASVHSIRKVDNPAFPAMVLHYLTHVAEG